MTSAPGQRGSPQAGGQERRVGAGWLRWRLQQGAARDRPQRGRRGRDRE